MEAFGIWQENLNLNSSYMFSFSETRVKFECFVNCFFEILFNFKFDI